MTTWRARLAVLAVFVAGFLCGGAAANLYRLRIENEIVHSPDVMIQVVLYKMGRELELTDSQKEEVRQALLDARTEILHQTKDVLPQFKNIFEKTQGRIRAVLTPEQQEKFDRVIAERRSFMQEMERKAQQP
ncbi:MAG: hypothetical protein HYX75_01260 [Acidobacteria bacterium]|nr:hypothetical protein [Acidobacteriota bacterium]